MFTDRSRAVGFAIFMTDAAISKFPRFDKYLAISQLAEPTGSPKSHRLDGNNHPNRFAGQSYATVGLIYNSGFIMPRGFGQKLPFLQKP